MNRYAIALACALSVSSCTKQDAKTVTDITLKVADATCIVLNAHLDEKAIRTACQIEHLAAPIIQSLVGATRTSGARAPVKDAGVADR